MNRGIVGAEAGKFTPVTEAAAMALIDRLLQPGDTVVSGRSPLGGVDIFAEVVAAARGLPALIYPPATNNWQNGYKPRNLQIASASDLCHCITVTRAALPPGEAKRWESHYCYHCRTSDHVKSGGCWTALRCARRQWHVIQADGSVVDGPVEEGGRWVKL